MGTTETALEARPAIAPSPADEYEGLKDRKDPSAMTRLQYAALLGAILVALLVRIPGVFWGANFPFGWYTHHVDEYTHLVNAEMLIDPGSPPRWKPHPYPKGMAAHVAVPVIGVRALQGKLHDGPPTPRRIITAGRVFGVLYGVATVFVVFLLAWWLFRDPRIAILAAWIFALGGLHVSQSHFFLSDVPALFWFLLACYLLILDFHGTDKNRSQFLMWAAFCLGVAFGLKLTVVGLPTLVLVAIVREPRFVRAIYAGVFFLAGFSAVNFTAYTIYDLNKALTEGISDPWHFSPLASLSLYLIELPSIVGFPVLILAVVGSYFLTLRLLKVRSSSQFWPIVLIVLLPLVIHALLIVFKLDHFPRHLVPFIPWISLLAAWSLVRMSDRLAAKRLRPALITVPFFVYLALLVFDGERVYLMEPRNEAGRWIQQNVQPGTSIFWDYHGWLDGYKHVTFPEQGKPDVVVIEMHRANHYLSGLGWKNSYPRDFRYIFDSRSQARIDALQSLFRGTGGYTEIARFSEGYIMPEYVWVDRLIGNRSRNYVAEVVIFRRKGEFAGGDS